MLGQDGTEYGPVDMDGLRAWMQDRRIKPYSKIKVSESGEIMQASMVPGLYQDGPPADAVSATLPPIEPELPTPVPQEIAPVQVKDYTQPPVPGLPQTDYSKPPVQQNLEYPNLFYNPTDTSGLIKVIVFVFLGFIVFLLLHGIGIFFCAYSVGEANRLKKIKNNYANLAQIIAWVSMGLILLLWILRLVKNI